MNLENHCLCFNFEPAGDNFYIIDSKLMKFLVEKLELDYKEIDFNKVEEVNFFDSIEMSVKRTFTLIKSTYNEFYKIITKEK